MRRREQLSNKETREQEKAVEEAVETVAEDVPKAPEPTATGNDQVAILKHDLYRDDGDAAEAVAVELGVKNVSDTTIGGVLFAAELYDIDGNVMDTVEKKTIDFKPGITRTIRLEYSGADSDKVRSYCVKVVKVSMPPQPEATGNESIKILKHNLNEGLTGDHRKSGCGADVSIRNVSQSSIASIVFEATFYDIEGNVMETIKHREIELRSGNSRAVSIQCSKQGTNTPKSYSVKIVRMTTADAEKVQLRRHEIRSTDNGEEEVRGIVKNISNEKTDIALAATFFDYKKENIGTRVIILRDIGPNDIKQFHFVFKPIEGDKVKSYNLNIGDLVE